MKLQFWIPGRAIGKARPRFSSVGSSTLKGKIRRKVHVHSAPKYAIWKNKAIATICQWMHSQNVTFPLMTKVQVDCLFVNFASSDTDNLQGSVLDGMVQAKMLQNDSSGFVIGSSGRFVKARKKKGQDRMVGVLVTVTPATVELVDLDLLQSIACNTDLFMLTKRENVNSN